MILAHQRLAAAKNAVAQQQRIASAKEAHAAAALQSSAHAAAAEIQRSGLLTLPKIHFLESNPISLSEHEASRLAAIQRSGSAAAAHHLIATKDSIVSPLLAGNNHIPTAVPLAIPSFLGPQHPWHSLSFATEPKWPSHTGVFAQKPISVWG